MVGSVKWRTEASFGRDDLGDLLVHRAQVPGADADTRLIGVSRAGFAVPGLDAELHPHDIVDAFGP